MAESTIRLALVGCGRIAQTHIQACAETGAARIVAVADPRPLAAASVAEAIGTVPHYADYRDMVAHERFDAAIVCSPPNTHATIVSDLLSRDIHVLCEKPFTLRTHDALELKRRAEARRTVLMMASKFRFAEDVVKARGLIRSGIVGQVVLLDLAFCSRVPMNGRWNAQPEVAGGGVLMDNGPHAVDVIRFLVGPIARVHAQHGRAIQSLPVEDTSHIQFVTEAGIVGSLTLSWSLNKEADDYVRVLGSEGTLCIGWQQSRYRRVEKPEWTVCGNGYHKQAAFNGQLRNFIACVKGEEAPLVTIDDAVESVRVVEAAYRSIEQGAWLHVDAGHPAEVA